MMTISRVSLALRAPVRRSFATTSLRAADGRGDAGHTTRDGSFAKREKAQEEQYIVQQEREKYRLAQQKLEQQKKDLDALEAKEAEKNAKK